LQSPWRGFKAHAELALSTTIVGLILRLHYIPGTAAMAPHAALAEAGADYTLSLVERDELGQSPAAYLGLNPWGLVPTLEDDDLVLTESAAIVLHIADRFPEARLVPALGTRARSDEYRWLAYLTSTVQTSLFRSFYPERCTTDSAGAAAIRAHEAATLSRHLDWLDAELATRPWLVGQERTGADLFLLMLTRWGRLQDPPAWRRPNLRDHFRRLLERPGVQRMMAEQGLELPDLSA
jgi:glutathione S-transferase